MERQNTMNKQNKIHASILQLFIIFLIAQVPLAAEKVETFYGSIEIEEPVLLELIKSPAF